MTRSMESSNWSEVDAKTSGPFLCMRLMCSQDRTEIEAVKNELHKAGIPFEVRSHPVAQSLGLAALELWVPDERDFFNASTLFGRMKSRASRPAAQPQFETERAAPPAWCAIGADARPAREPGSGKLDQATTLLRKEIQEMLDRESALAAERESLRRQVKELVHALAASQAALAQEAENRQLAEKIEAEKASGLQSTLEHARAECASVVEQLARERKEWQQQLKSHDNLLKETQRKLDSTSRLLQSHQEAVADLKQEIVSLAQQRDDQEKALTEAREARCAAEERAERAAAAEKSLEQQLAAQKELDQQMQAHVASLNSLCSKLHATRAGG